MSCSVQLTAGVKGLVRAVAAIILDIAHQVQWDAALVGTLELGGRAGLHGAGLRVLVTAVCTVVYAIAVRGHRDALLVLALELVIQAPVVACRDAEQRDQLSFTGKIKELMGSFWIEVN